MNTEKEKYIQILAKIVDFLRKETVLSVAWLLAIISAFFIKPNASYIDYIDFRSLGILWSLMVVMQGLKKNELFNQIGISLLNRMHKVWQLSAVLIFLCFFGSMLITNDVALITFVSFAIVMLQNAGREDLLIPVIVLQTIAANLGSMLTPIGNPQNLYLYGISGMSVGAFIAWMFPYTLVAMLMLVISICLLKGKNDKVSVKQSSYYHIKRRTVAVYLLLFLAALLVVAKVMDYYYLVGLVLIIVFILEKRTLVEIDYALLFTFVGFFIFTGNLGKVVVIQNVLTSLVNGREILIGVIASQGISNVPAALLLSSFTDNYKLLLLGVNLGGLGTLIASMASLISFKSLAHAYNELKGKYLLVFTGMNLLYLAVLMGLAYILN